MKTGCVITVMGAAILIVWILKTALDRLIGQVGDAILILAWAGAVCVVLCVAAFLAVLVLDTAAAQRQRELWAEYELTLARQAYLMLLAQQPVVTVIDVGKQERYDDTFRVSTPSPPRRQPTAR